MLAAVGLAAVGEDVFGLEALAMIRIRYGKTS
jgi:hypothetical protein